MTIEAIFTHFPSIETEHPILRQILSIAGESSPKLPGEHSPELLFKSFLVGSLSSLVTTLSSRRGRWQ